MQPTYKSIKNGKDYTPEQIISEMTDKIIEGMIVKSQIRQRLRMAFNLTDGELSVLESFIFKAVEEQITKIEEIEEQVVETAEQIAPADLNLSNAMSSFMDQYWITAEKLADAELKLKKIIPLQNIFELNKTLKAENKREVNHKDIAFIWMALKHNALKNKDGSSPVKGIKGLSRVSIRCKVIENAPDYRHIQFAIVFFEALNLLKKHEDKPLKGSAQKYIFFPNSYDL